MQKPAVSDLAVKRLKLQSGRQLLAFSLSEGEQYYTLIKTFGSAGHLFYVCTGMCNRGGEVQSVSGMKLNAQSRT
jgi:hypothetical protein